MQDRNSAPSDEDSHEIERQNTTPQLIVEGTETFNYAAWQNAVPLLRSVTIENKHGEVISSLTVELSASPAFARDKRWVVDRIGAGETFSLRDIEIDVDPDYLDRLDEAVRGVLTLRLMHQGETICETKHPLRVLARDEWGGMPTMAELLPAFVTPNDPSLAPLLKSASAILKEHGKPTGLDGYQSGDPNRAYLLASSLWSAIAGRALTYANPPGSFEQVGQKTRRTAAILGDGLATCLDTTLLFASALEAIGLNPVLVMTDGHCFAGLWLVEKTSKRLVEKDCSELRKAVAAKELVVFETTLVTHQPAGRFPDAMAIAEDLLAEDKEHEFVGAVDVARARMSQVLPIASHGHREPHTAEEPEVGPPSLATSPGFDKLPATEAEEQPRTPGGRIERWQRKLLDLTLRNRLLNFRPTKQTVPVLCPNVSRLEDCLADGKRLRMISIDDSHAVQDRDAELHHKRTKTDLNQEFAREALERNEVACPVTEKDLNARLTALYRKARNDLAEGGSNTLYLAVGFLRWKQMPTAEKTYRAPLLLIPVKLTRRSASSPYYLSSHEDDVRFNATLLQLLKKDFDCDLTFFEDDLPTDDSGVDVPAVLERMRRAVREIPGFEVVEDVAIAPFSFAKYLMWKDLVERVGELDHNRVVRHLIHEPDKAFEPQGVGPMPRAYEIDTRYDPTELVHPLPADSSQLAAVMAAAEGHDFVIVGPPGTGKSQTIANMIAQCLAVGKTVLFVAEKTAALDVVHRRLRGLGDCCVELHSNKAERRRFLDQLKDSWTNRTAEDGSEWLKVSDRLRIRRDELNAYVAALHTSSPNGWTAYQAMGVSVRGSSVETPKFDWPTSVRHDRESYESLKATAGELASTFQATPAEATLPRVEATEWSMGWETQLLECCRRLEEASESLAGSIEVFCRLLGMSSLTDISSTQLTPLFRLARELTQLELPPTELVLHERLDELRSVLDDRRELLQQQNQAKEALKGALDGFAEAVGVSLPGNIPEEMKRPLYLLANELVRPELPPADLVFHGDFDGLTKALGERPSLMQTQNQAFEGLKARSFNQALVGRIKVVDLEREWTKASSSFWPLSAWRMSKAKKKLKTFMAIDSVAEPEVDLPLLRDYKDSSVRLVENLASLGLPSRLQSVVEQDPGALDSQIKAASLLREAMDSAGLPPSVVAKASHGDLELLINAARRLYPPGREIESIRVRLKDNDSSLGLPAHLRATVERDAGALDSEIQAAIKLRENTISLGFAGSLGSQILQSILAAPGQLRSDSAGECCMSAKAFQGAWLEYTDLAKATPVDKDSSSIIADASAQAKYVLSNRTALKQWTAWVAVRRKSEQHGLSNFVSAIQAGELVPDEAESRFELAYARWWLPQVIDKSEPLRTFQRFRHEEAIEDFCRLDDLARQAASPRARMGIKHGLPPSDQVPRKSELGLLRHQMKLKRPSKSIREVISGMPETFSKLTPCLLMSPLSIAQYLPAEQALFDVVVFDEASQIPTWDAIGAIARGKQTIIVGDPKQLPPTNFFGKADSDEDEEIEDHEKDLESILDEAQASGLPTLQLNWHYRSQHESLITFSNWNYYDNRLVTFPAAESEDRGVSLQHIDGGLYDRGKSRTNRQEADAIVVDLVKRMKRCLAKPQSERLTYGVVTFNSQQQELIQDLLDEAQRQHPKLEWFFSDDRIEPTAVKNLENVQGDERDVMMFSIAFGFDVAGKFPVDFGAINRDGGERRLNVAITRARQELVVFASFLPEQLRAERSSARGVNDLKAFLEFADKGPEAIAARTEGSLGGYESPLEEEIAAALEDRGWRIDPQVGVSGFRVDLGVVHPDKPGAFLAGVECDGATYHRSAVARDRDKTRQQVLENLGWTIFRVWSTDWWYDSLAAIDRLHEELTKRLEATRQETPAQPDDSHSTENVVTRDEDNTSQDGDDQFEKVTIDSESQFEEVVAQALENVGWQIEPQVEVSGSRIDLGVVHPDKPGEYLAGVECDGGGHRSDLARDRDKIRQLDLEDLGRTIFRVLSTNWFDDPATAIVQLHESLSQHLNASRRRAVEALSIQTGVLHCKQVPDSGPSTPAMGKVDQPKPSAQQEGRQFFLRTNLPDATTNQDRFFDADYSKTLRAMALHVLESQGPIREDALAREVARAHGFARTGNKIKQRLLELLPDVTATVESVGRFLWATDLPLRSITFRYPAPDGERRSLDEVAMPELVGLIEEHPDLAAADDPAIALARTIGLARLAQPARDRLEQALEQSTAEG